MRKIVNETEMEVPTWIKGEGAYINALEEKWREVISDLFVQEKGEMPEDVTFGFLLTTFNTKSRRDGNLFLIVPAEISDPGTAGTRSFRKKWNLNDHRRLVEAAKMAFYDGEEAS